MSPFGSPDTDWPMLHALVHALRRTLIGKTHARPGPQQNGGHFLQLLVRAVAGLASVARQSEQYRQLLAPFEDRFTRYDLLQDRPANRLKMVTHLSKMTDRVIRDTGAEAL